MGFLAHMSIRNWLLMTLALPFSVLLYFSIQCAGRPHHTLTRDAGLAGTLRLRWDYQ